MRKIVEEYGDTIVAVIFASVIIGIFIWVFHYTTQF